MKIVILLLCLPALASAAHVGLPGPPKNQKGKDHKKDKHKEEGKKGDSLVKFCPNPPALTDPKVSSSTCAVFEPGDYITYSCPTGYELDGSATNVCQRNKEWSIQPPHLPFCRKSCDQSKNKTKEYAASCLQLMRQGIKEDGFHYIQQKGVRQPYLAYCDMTTARGGWTLVAAINEENLKGQCASDDVWMRFTKDLSSDDNSHNNWENRNTFGCIDKDRVGNYKNSGYFSVHASDVMVRHVPQHVRVNESRRNAFLEYHTEDNFLKEHGGNLYRLFNQHYPLEPVGAIYLDTAAMLDELADRADEIAGEVPDFYQYKYEEHPYELYDGGKNMFYPSGMRVGVGVSSCSSMSTLPYEHEFNCDSKNIYYNSKMSHPFHGVFVIGNDDTSKASYIQIEVERYRPSTEDDEEYEGSITDDNYELEYLAYCQFGMQMPSMCDIFYVISNIVEWNSTENITVVESNLYSYNHFVEIRIRVEDSPENAVFGYTMLSRTEGRRIKESSIEGALGVILDTISGFSSFDDPDDVADILDALESRNDEIRSQMSNFYRYEYKPKPYAIYDGGNNMYAPYGPWFHLWSDYCFWVDLLYGKTYWCHSDYLKVSSRTSYPMHILYAVGNYPEMDMDFGIEMAMSRWSNDMIQNYEGDLSDGSFRLRYKAFCRYGMTSPSICDVFYLATNVKDWGSTPGVPFEIRTSSISRSFQNHASEWEGDYHIFEYLIEGTPRAVLMGYTLLSRSKGKLVSADQVNNVMEIIFESISRFPNFDDILDTPDLEDLLASREEEIIAEIPDFYKYNYDSNSYYLETGGNNMYTDYGLDLEVYTPSCKNAEFALNMVATCEKKNLRFDSRQSHPFIGLLTIGNYDRTEEYIRFRLQGENNARSDYDEYEGSLRRDSFRLRYITTCRYGLRYPSSCEVFFLVTNELDWKSSPSIGFEIYDSWNWGDHAVEVQVDNSPSNAILGFTLLSRTEGQEIKQKHTEDALYKMLEIISKYPNIADPPRPGLSEPVKFTVGARSLETRLPPSLLNDVETGFLDFRRFGRLGSAYAICPAVRPTGIVSEYFCVGGAQNPHARSDEDCNNFLKWNGASFDHALPHAASGRAHSSQDINSSIMIFYR